MILRPFIAVMAFAILNIALPRAICLLLAGKAYDLAVSGEFAQRTPLNVHWILTSIGYFAAAVAGFLALGFCRELQAIRAQSRGFRHKSARPDPGAELSYEVADIEFDPRSPA